MASLWMKLGFHDLSGIDIHAERIWSQEVHPVGLFGMCVSLEDEFHVVIGLFSLAPGFTGEPGPAGAIGGAADTGIGVGLPGAGVEVLTGRTVPAPVIAGARGEPVRALSKRPSPDLDVVAAF